MSGAMTWAMPDPPPAYVISVRDGDGREWRRYGNAGTLWARGDRIESWDWLIYNRGPLTEGQVAP